MSLIRLKNVSKFYYSKGVIASGFSKVNLSLDMGEFVVITGESGSGKSTLLNVISGLDTYEEGEMYINGEETSHYTEKDFEDYRRKYVGNIFQNFNLVNSYTVYQNIELVLLLNGNKKRKVKKQVLELIKKVGLYKFRNTKASKLSGGQKQRVAIARALAKDTPIIIADEPTGNLDSKSSKAIIELLKEVSKDKLVIIVTHNYEQVEKEATRKIRMHDGRILEDKKLKEVENNNLESEKTYKNITFFNKVRLALRNTFNIVSKFLLMLLVYLFITVSLLSEYASFKEQEYIESKSGDNYIFSNISDKRIILKKSDKSSFTDDDYKKLEEIKNIDYIVKNDLLLDSYVNFTNDDDFWIGGTVNSIENFRGELDFGEMPKEQNQIVVEGNENDYYIGYQKDQIFNKKIYLNDSFTGDIDRSESYEIVGIKYNKNSYNYNLTIYVSDELLDKMKFSTNQNYSDIKILFLNKYKVSNFWGENAIRGNDKVPKGEAYISNDLSYECPNEYCIKQSLKIEVSNLYYKDSLDLKVSKVYTKQNLNYLLGLSDYDVLNGSIFINTDDYDSLFDKEYYQSSVFVKDVFDIENTIKELQDMGYDTLALKNTLVNSGISKILGIIRTVVTVILVVVLFFISYFVIRVILKSRNKYFSTIRMLGANKAVSKQLLVMELLTVANIAYFSFVILIYLNSLKVINIGFINNILLYLKLKDYIVLYLILILMSLVISGKFSKKLFKKSAIATMGEEV